MSGNHNQSLDRALEIVDAASNAGADAIKLQTYTPDTMTLDQDGLSFTINDKESLWHGKNLYELYKQAYTPWEWHKPIMEYAQSKGLICFSSPFDETAVDFLESLNVPAYKIASFENNHLPLIEKTAATGKPLIISTGMATLGELERTLLAARSAGCDQVILLKCTSTYPASPCNTNITTIPHMRQLFDCQVGLSDHTTGIGVSIASVALGATVIEKHFTLSRADGGVDSAFSLEPHELSSLVQESRRAWESLGGIFYGPTEAEQKSLPLRRSIFVVRDISKGERFSKDNLSILRPSIGAPPHYFSTLLGQVATRSYKKGEPLSVNSLL